MDYQGTPPSRTEDTLNGNIEVNQTDTYIDRVPAIPAAESDAIVIGEIASARARMSQPPNNPGVISEFTIRVDEVLKANGLAPLVSRVTVVVEREGGRMRYPSGRIVKFTPSGQRMPRVGKRYVLLRFTVACDH